MAEKTMKAWAAGIVDGEGYVALAKRKDRKNKMPIVAVHNTNMDILNVLQRHFGGKIYINRRNFRPNCKPCWFWRITGRKCILFLKGINPWLVGKKDKSNEVMKYGEYLLGN